MAPYSIHNTRQRTLIIVPTVFTVLAIFFTGMRVYARRLQKTKVLLDDYLCILACILGLALLGGNVAMVVAAGSGTSILKLHSPNDFLLWYKLTIVTYMLWGAAIAVVQMAILVFYQRIFWVVDWFRRTCYTIMAIVVVWFISLYIMEFVVCKPVQKTWNPLVDGKCGDFKKMCNAIGLTHAIIDFSVLFIPVPLIWNMKISVVKKSWLSVLFLAGIFATISSMLRLECLFNFRGYNPDDPIWSMWLPWVYTLTELPVAIICCSAPAIPTVAKHLQTSALGKYITSILSRSFRSSQSRPLSKEVEQTPPKMSPQQEGSHKSEESIQLQTYGFVDGPSSL